MAALPTGLGYTNVTVAGNDPGTVSIVGMRVVKNCGPPLDGTLFDSPAQGTGGTIGMGFNLDSATDTAEVDNGAGITPGSDFFHGHVITLASGETHTLTINVLTTMYYCQFSFEMSVATPAGLVYETISDNGGPFELSATLRPSAYKALYVGGNDALGYKLNTTGAWVREDPRRFKGFP